MRKDPVRFRFAGLEIPRNSETDIKLKVSETYSGDEVRVPMRVLRGRKPGPIVFITAAVHGDEINGTGIIHDFLYHDRFPLKAGTLILVPVVNVFGFENNERYMPDRRDLNRSFPGSITGSLSSRIAQSIHSELILKCHFGIDLHTAAFQRTNFPNVRADLKNPGCRELARAFGGTLVVDGKGPDGSLRKEATRSGVPTIILEAGEPFKMESTVLEFGIRGINNVLRSLGMMDGKIHKPPFQAEIRKTTWLRAEVGGILRFAVEPGAFVSRGDTIANNFSILGAEQRNIIAPADGIILGMTTMPAVKPGEPICHLAFPTRKISVYKQHFENRSEEMDANEREELLSRGIPHVQTEPVFTD